MKRLMLIFLLGLGALTPVYADDFEDFVKGFGAADMMNEFTPVAISDGLTLLRAEPKLNGVRMIVALNDGLANQLGQADTEADYREIYNQLRALTYGKYCGEDSMFSNIVINEEMTMEFIYTDSNEQNIYSIFELSKKLCKSPAKDGFQQFLNGISGVAVERDRLPRGLGDDVYMMRVDSRTNGFRYHVRINSAVTNEWEWEDEDDFKRIFKHVKKTAIEGMCRELKSTEWLDSGKVMEMVYRDWHEEEMYAIVELTKKTCRGY